MRCNDDTTRANTLFDIVINDDTATGTCDATVDDGDSRTLDGDGNNKGDGDDGRRIRSSMMEGVSLVANGGISFVVAFVVDGISVCNEHCNMAVSIFQTKTPVSFDAINNRNDDIHITWWYGNDGWDDGNGVVDDDDDDDDVVADGVTMVDPVMARIIDGSFVNCHTRTCSW
jgi:hypothetical protein